MGKKVLGGIPITPHQLAAQWRFIPYKFAVNLWNFEVKAGKEAVEVFKESFDLKRLNASNSMLWRPRKDNRPHPLLNETSSLKNSIKWKRIGFIKSKGVNIYTDPKGFRNTNRHRGFCYAAVHNDPSGSHTYGRSGSPSIQRQFMGHSNVLDDKIESIARKVVFKGFPKVGGF